MSNDILTLTPAAKETMKKIEKKLSKFSVVLWIENEKEFLAL